MEKTKFQNTITQSTQPTKYSASHMKLENNGLSCWSEAKHLEAVAKTPPHQILRHPDEELRSRDFSKVTTAVNIP
jgi:hypothetical protein